MNYALTHTLPADRYTMTAYRNELGDTGTVERHGITFTRKPAPDYRPQILVDGEPLARDYQSADFAMALKEFARLVEPRAKVANDPYNAPRFSLADLAAMIHDARPVLTMDPQWCTGVNAGREFVAGAVCDRLDSCAERERFRLDCFPKSGQPVTQ